MAKKERAPKKEKPTQREKEIFKKSAAERRENRKSKGITAIVTIVVVLLLIGISTIVGLVVKDTPANSAGGEQNDVRNREWVLSVLLNYDSTVSYLTEQGYVAGTDFIAEYDETKAEENDGVVGSIISSGELGSFEIYYFARTSSGAATKNAQAYYNKNMAKKVTADSTLDGRNYGTICFAGKGEPFHGLFWKYYIING